MYYGTTTAKAAPEFRGGNRGFGLVEIVAGAAVLSLSFGAIFFFFQKALEVNRETTRRIQATFLLGESFEAVKLLRDASWQRNIASLAAGTSYYLEFASGSWATTTANTFVDDVFERKIVAQNVNRDGNDDIVASGGTLDPNTRKITASVSWRSGSATSTRSIETYVTNLWSN